MHNTSRGKQVFLASALYDALEDGKVSHLETLLEKTGADPNVLLPTLGVSPLHLAVGNESESFAEEVTKLFLQNGGDPNVRTVEDQTPVHIAACWGRTNIVKLLLINGGDPWLCDADDNNAYCLAFRGKHWEIVELLKTYHLEDLQKDDSSQQKYTMMLDKVVLYNNSVAIQYKEASCTRSVGVQTCEAPNVTEEHFGILCVGDHSGILENESSEISTEDENTSLKMQGTRQHGLTSSFPHQSLGSDEQGNQRIDCSDIGNKKSCDVECTEGISDRNTRNYIYLQNTQEAETGFWNDCSIMTEDGCDGQEWAASRSCFQLLEQSDYETCDEVNMSSASESFFSIAEEYKYSDEDGGVVLLEKRFLVPPVGICHLQPKQRKTSEDLTEDNELGQCDSSSVPSSLDYETDILRTRLKDRGFVPGPIIPSTKKLYLRKLVRLEKSPMRISAESKVYSPELQRTLHGFSWGEHLADYLRLEKDVVEQFSRPELGRRWREGNIKSSFTYLLLDPRVTQNLPCRVDTLSKQQVWSLFLSAIFYVGKGKQTRPYSHLHQALAVWNSGAQHTGDSKLQYIMDVWKAGMGVVCLHIYQNVIPVEAYTREAAIIDSLGLTNLKNARCGDYYGVASTWTSHEKRMLGTFLLYRAMLIFLQEGERQLRPGNIA